MNIRKPIDYSSMYVALDRLMVEELPQVELYFEIGRAVCARTEKGVSRSRFRISASGIS